MYGTWYIYARVRLCHAQGSINSCVDKLLSLVHHTEVSDTPPNCECYVNKTHVPHYFFLKDFATNYPMQDEEVEALLEFIMRGGPKSRSSIIVYMFYAIGTSQAGLMAGMKMVS